MATRNRAARRHPFTANFSAAFTLTSPRMAWEFKAQAGDTVDVYVYDQIGENFWGEGTSASDFVQELASYKNAKQINLHVNSPGGYVNEGLAMYNAILQHPADVTAFVEGEAASAASFLVMAAAKVVMFKTSNLFIHDAQGMAMGNAADMRLLADILDEQSDNIAGIYADKAGQSASYWRDQMRASDGYGSSFRGQAAVDAGLADEVRAAPSKNETRFRPVAQRDDADPAEPDPVVEEPEEILIDLDLIPPLANGYEKPLPADLTRLITANMPASKG